MNKNNIGALLFFFLITFAYSQEEAQYTQYMNNTNIVNPAYAGIKSGIKVFFLNRSQWVGIDGAPSSYNISASTPFKESMGLGVNIVNNSIGPVSENSFSADYSYSILIGDNAQKLSFGLKGAYNLLSIDFTKLLNQDIEDLAYAKSISNQGSPNIGFGVYLNSNKYYVGLSLPRLLQTKHFDPNRTGGTAILEEKMNIYLIGGYVHELIEEDLLFKPSILFRYTSGVSPQIDISANFLINQKFTAGLSYRLSQSISGMAGFQVSEKFMVGYSYDFDTNAIIRQFSGGSHEIFVKYQFLGGGDQYRIIAPRFF